MAKARSGGEGEPLSRTYMAEEVGFEPTDPCRSHDFQSCRFGRSRTPPRRIRLVPRQATFAWSRVLHPLVMIQPCPGSELLMRRSSSAALPAWPLEPARIG